MSGKISLKVPNPWNNERCYTQNTGYISVSSLALTLPELFLSRLQNRPYEDRTNMSRTNM